MKSAVGHPRDSCWLQVPERHCVVCQTDPGPVEKMSSGVFQWYPEWWKCGLTTMQNFESHDAKPKGSVVRLDSLQPLWRHPLQTNRGTLVPKARLWWPMSTPDLSPCGNKTIAKKYPHSEPLFKRKVFQCTLTWNMTNLNEFEIELLQRCRLWVQIRRFRFWQNQTNWNENQGKTRIT